MSELLDLLVPVVEDIVRVMNDFNLIPNMILGFVMASISISVIYLLGKMLRIVTYWKTKSWIALLISLISTVFYVVFSMEKTGVSIINNTVVIMSFAVIFYVNFYMRLFERLDNFWDSKLGKDLGEKFLKTDVKKKTKKSIWKVLFG